MRKRNIVLISSIQACLIFFSFEVANALILHVPADYPTIQTGIDAAVTQEPGGHRYIWDGTDRNCKAVSTGIYFYQLYVDDPATTTAGRHRESKAMILVK
jgi:hypothetical protein